MNRRDLVKYLGAASLLPFLPRSAEAATAIAERLAKGDVPFRTLNVDQRALVAQLADIIIPRTDTPGALDVKVPEFVDLILTEWATDDERKEFLDGLGDIDKRAAALGVQQQGGTQTAAKFVDLPADSRLKLATELDAARYEKGNAAGRAFGRLKHLTVYGYFTSKRVEEEVLHMRMFFDGYHGNVPFTPAV